MIKSGMAAVAVLTGIIRLMAQEPVHFACAGNTGNNATVAITTSAQPQIFGQPLEQGDEIGAFTPAGICAGAVLWKGANTAITLWGDDEMTPEPDGFKPNDPLAFHIWDASAGIEYETTCTFQMGPDTYQPNGISVLAALSASNQAGAAVTWLADGKSDIDMRQNYPNPANPATQITFYLSESSHAKVTISTILGQEVRILADRNFNASEHILFWDGLSSAGTIVPSGCYLYTLAAGKQTVTRQLLLVR